MTVKNALGRQNELAHGALIDHRYRVGALLGEGGSARVFAATDTRLERPVAIKVLRQPGGVDDALIKRFENEGRALAKLSHPNVVAVHDVGCTRDGILFLVMELATAGTLELELERRDLLPAHELVPLLLPVMGALACAHDVGIIHRDLKPGNIALARVGNAVRAKVLDFGIAKSRGVDTNSGRAWGTPAYMAPEQARAGEVGPYTDVWAMGVTLFHGLSGRLPFDGPVDANVLLQIVSGRAPRLADVCATVGKQLAIAIDRALEPNTNDRYRDMREFARAIGIACRLDGLPIPDAPDPVGLPRFGAWFAEADVQATRDMTAVVPPRVEITSAPHEHVRQGATRGLWRWALALAAVAAGAAVVSAWIAPALGIRLPATAGAGAQPLVHTPGASSAPPVAEAPQPGMAAALASPPAQATPVLEQSAAAPDHAQATRDRATPPRPGRRQAARERPSIAPATQATGSEPASAPGQAPTPLITRWDW